MILSSADILRILGGSEIIRLSAKIKVVDGKPALSGAEGLSISVERFPKIDEFEATWTLYVESDGSEPDDLVLAEIRRLLPSVTISEGLLTTVTTTDFLSENTQRAPEAPKAVERQVVSSEYEERFQALVEDVQDQMLLVTSGRPGRDGRDGVNGKDGLNGRDIVATETDLEDLANVEQGIAKKNGQVLTWKDGKWQNLFIPERQKIGGSGGSQEQSDWAEVDPQEPSFILNKPTLVENLDDLGDVSVPTPSDLDALVWNSTTNTWEAVSIGNGSAINSSEWKFSTQTTGSPATGYFFFDNANPALATEAYISDFNNDGKDVSLFLKELIVPGVKLYAQDSRDSDNAILLTVTANPIDNGAFLTVLVSFEAGQGVIANNKLCAVSLVGGGGVGTVTVIDDLLDVDTTTTLPQMGDILKWDGSQWVPDATAGTGIPEAPNDGKYYVRQNGTWIDLQVALGQITTPGTNVDGADFTQGITTAQNTNTYDGGDFTTGSSTASDSTFLDGEVFTGALEDTVIDGGTAST